MSKKRRDLLLTLLREAGLEQGVFLGWSESSGYQILSVGSTDENRADAQWCARRMVKHMGISRARLER